MISKDGDRGLALERSHYAKTAPLSDYHPFFDIQFKCPIFAPSAKRTPTNFSTIEKRNFGVVKNVHGRMIKKGRKPTKKL